MTRLKNLLLFSGTIVLFLSMFFSNIASASFSKNNLIDDSIFNNDSSMSSSQINAFLNSKHSSCISPNSGFQAKKPTGYSPSGGYTYGSYVSAGTVIATAAQAYDLNPRVLLATLQKEQSIVTGAGGCGKLALTASMGYGCPDNITSHNYSGVSLYKRNGKVASSVTGTCVNKKSKAGFSQQVIRGAWLLKFGQQRSLGRTNWAIIKSSWDNSDDLSTCYEGPMTKGSFKRCPSGNTVYYDGYQTIDGSAAYMGSGATAALYWYTPHYHGNQSFVAIYESWFGSTRTNVKCTFSQNIGSTPSGNDVVKNNSSLIMTARNNTSSTCIEMHELNSSLSGWRYHYASNSPVTNPTGNEIISADTNGDGKDELILVRYQGTGSGKIEIHRWKSGYKSWASNIATNHPVVSPDNARIISADTNGDGKDELILVRYQGTGSGKIEIHRWKSGYKSWASNIATNFATSDPADVKVLSTNRFSDKKDEIALLLYTNTSSGKVELHTWKSGYKTWREHLATLVSL